MALPTSSIDFPTASKKLVNNGSIWTAWVQMSSTAWWLDLYEIPDLGFCYCSHAESKFDKICWYSSTRHIKMINFHTFEDALRIDPSKFDDICPFCRPVFARIRCPSLLFENCLHTVSQESTNKERWFALPDSSNEFSDFWAVRFPSQMQLQKCIELCTRRSRNEIVILKRHPNHSGPIFSKRRRGSATNNIVHQTQFSHFDWNFGDHKTVLHSQ